MIRGVGVRGQLAALGLAIVAVLFALPFLGGYELLVTTDLLITIILVVSFRFITTMGRWSFAHVALAGAGGYAAAIAATRFDLEFWFTIGLGGAAASALAFLISFPTMRTTGFYFFMSTFAAGALIVWSWTAFPMPFGGTSGIYGVARPDPLMVGSLTLPIGSPLGFAYVVAILTGASLVTLLRLEQIRFGSILKAIRWQTALASSLGLNVRRYETAAFVVGSFFAGVAGVLLVYSHGIAFPSDFGTLKGLDVVMFTVIGGAESFWGPPIGAIVMTIITQGIQQYPALVPLTPLVFGVVTIAIVLVLPVGLVSLPTRIGRLGRRKRNDSE